MQEHNIVSISMDNPLYPEDFERLKPKVRTFYAKGNISLLQSKHKLGIIGSRLPSSYGIDNTKLLTKAAVQAGAVTVSGLALGIDSICHTETLKYGGKTIAVLAGGVQRIHPSSHTNLAKLIVDNGGLLISEYVDTEPNRYSFVKRNRLISGLADVLLVPEATVKSGSKHTLRFSHDLEKTIAVVPGRTDHALSALPNQWARDGAQIIIEPDDLITLLKLNKRFIDQKNTYTAANPTERSVIKVLQEQPLTNDQLITKLKLETEQCAISLTMLEIQGIVIRSPDNTWKLAK